MPFSVKYIYIKKKVFLICVFPVGFITQHPHYLIIYNSNQNLRIACLLSSVTAVRKHVTAAPVLFLACLVSTAATLMPCVPSLTWCFSRPVGTRVAQQWGEAALGLGSLLISFAERLAT